MTPVLPTSMTLTEFLAWEEQQELRYEFGGVRPIAMTGGTVRHSTIQVNLTVAIHGRLRGKPCQYFGISLKFQVADGHIRYPDGMVICSPGNGAATVVHDPTIVFEILSQETDSYDRIDKRREYLATPSVQRYVLLEQTRIGATVYARSGDAWNHEILREGSILALPEVEVELPLAELYEGVEVDLPATLDELEREEGIPNSIDEGLHLVKDLHSRSRSRSRVGKPADKEFIDSLYGQPTFHPVAAAGAYRARATYSASTSASAPRR